MAHRVEPGDHLSAIAHRMQCNGAFVGTKGGMKRLFLANPNLHNLNQIEVGQVLKLSTNTEESCWIAPPRHAQTFEKSKVSVAEILKNARESKSMLAH